MKSIADLLNQWKEENIELEVGCSFFFEKDWSFEERKDIPRECRIIVKIRDKFTYVDGVYSGKCFLHYFETTYQNIHEMTITAVENKQFELFLQKFTDESVSNRRKELQDLRMTGVVAFHV